MTKVDGTKAQQIQLAHHAKGVKGKKVHNAEANRLEKTGKNKFSDNRYDFIYDKGEFRIFDRETQTWVRVWGDPHVETSDGDKMQFHEKNLTIVLENGTKVTIDPTDVKDGVALIDKIAITTDKNGVVIRDVYDDPKAGKIRNKPEKIDARFEDGTTLYTDGEVDDLVAYVEMVLEGTAEGGGERNLDELKTNSRIQSGNGKDRTASEDKTDSRTRASSESDSSEEADRSSGADGIHLGFAENVADKVYRIDREIGKLMNDLKGFEPDENGVMPPEYHQTTFRLQVLMDLKRQLTELLSNVRRGEHEARMAVIRNLRS